MVQASIGEGMRHMEKRYRVSYNSQTGTWRLLDTWHEAMQKVTDWSAELPDDFPAMTLITDEGFTALAMEAARLGILGKAVIPKVDEEAVAELQNEIKKLETVVAEETSTAVKLGQVVKDQASRIEELNKELAKAQKTPPMSERFQLKSQAMQGILKLAGMEDIRDLDRG